MMILQRRPRQELAAAGFFGVCGRHGHTATPNWYLDFRFTRLRCLQGLYKAFPFLRGHRDMLPFPSEIQGLSLPASPFPIDSTRPKTNFPDGIPNGTPPGAGLKYLIASRVPLGLLGGRLSVVVVIVVVVVAVVVVMMVVVVL